MTVHVFIEEDFYLLYDIILKKEVYEQIRPKSIFNENY